MTPEKLKEILDSGSFSPEVQAVMSSILDTAIARGSVTEDEKTKLLGLIDLEVSAATIEADAMDDMAAALDDFTKETDEAIAAAQKDLESVNADLMSELQAITA
jgi:DNA polymerase III gamma/tau subunit